jgi:TatD DNase family protein
MNNSFIDIGINLSSKQYKNDIAAVIQRALAAGVQKMIVTGTGIRNSEEAAALAKQYPGTLFATAGIHPHEAKNFTKESIVILRRLLQQPGVVAAGECGLDFDRDFSPRPAQERCFEAQLQLAAEMKKPVFLHERAAFQQFNAIMDQFSGKLSNAVVHCFTGSLSEAKFYLDKGYFLGFTGAISDTKRFDHLKEVLAYSPLDRIMIETDGPYMLPKNVPPALLTPNNTRRNEPTFLPFVAKIIAAVKGISLQEVAVQTTQNATAFFGI